ncbi:MULTISPECIES: carboxymuconolactone decarboxylase family protein [Caldimonas]|uniref:carboxymuconolactone decarboxylase family protein n=1 Tax=Caldimonas TaxID=196013 RepID=UPI0012E9CB83|nr:carboxymuconolactone decarboxylase family protein [Caldimonas manganoxidans]MCX7660222.1 carboxymuconolactone decarboxylase family protein [Caldimonas manganoxidans]
MSHIPDPATAELTLNLSRDAFRDGLAMRRRVMGPDFVERAFANANDFHAELQQLVTALAWGTVWSRPGLDPKTRSMITVAMLVALGKRQELEGHVRGALNNGVTVEELKEILLHSALYCGFPAAIEGFRAAQSVIDAAGAAPTKPSA